ncbi:MAG TPA: PAS domain S-box protein [Methylomirabilota bacterium]|nr:PAS domain S-box protein [Methylomirabilota bacterium]
MTTPFETFLETVPDAMVVVDRQGRIVMVNSQAERLFGYRREQLLGLQVELLVPERYRGSHSEHREGYSTAPTVRPMGAAQELYGRRKDGSEFPVEISLAPVETEQGILVASAIRDITDRKRAEAQRASLIREHAARAQAEAANRAKDEFLATLSHELRNPLGAVLSAVALLDKVGLQEDPAIKARAIIRRQAQRLSRLLDDLLDIARLQTGREDPADNSTR